MRSCFLVPDWQLDGDLQEVFTQRALIEFNVLACLVSSVSRPIVLSLGVVEQRSRNHPKVRVQLRAHLYTCGLKRNLATERPARDGSSRGP